MATLNGQIDFEVKFDLTGLPTLKLKASSSIPGIDKPNLTGYFYIKQPDGIERTGDYITPDVAWSGSDYPEFSIPLRTASDGTYQKGNYIISFFAECSGYTPGVETKPFGLTFTPAKEILTQLFDLYTPSLKYQNDTVYTKGDFSITSQTESWAATCVAGSITPSSAALFDLAIGGNYYDSVYNITHNKTVTYQSIAYAWLTIIQDWDITFIASAYKPASMVTLLGYLDALKAVRDANSCDKSINEVYEDAAVLYGHIRSKVCAQITTGLKEYFDEFYRLTHNYQSPVYVNTNTIIPAYDFTTGCSGSGGGGSTVPTVVIECVIGNAYTITGGSATVTGLSNGSTSVSSADFSNVRLEIIRGNISIPGVNPLDGSNYFTKVLAANSFSLNNALVTGEYIKIKTIPN